MKTSLIAGGTLRPDGARNATLIILWRHTQLDGPRSLPIFDREI